jgi:hypothetical protein
MHVDARQWATNHVILTHLGPIMRRRLPLLPPKTDLNDTMMCVVAHLTHSQLGTECRLNTFLEITYISS